MTCVEVRVRLRNHRILDVHHLWLLSTNQGEATVTELPKLQVYRDERQQSSKDCPHAPAFDVLIWNVSSQTALFRWN